MSILSEENRRAVRSLVRRQHRVAVWLSATMLGIYFGFILVLAFARGLLAAKIAPGLTVGIPVGLGVILAAWALTGIYVRWANSVYDKSVQDILESMRRRP